MERRLGRKKIVAASCTLYSSLIIVKSLQLRGRRQIAEPCKYCLVRVIVFFGVCFLYFLFLTSWELGEIPYKLSNKYDSLSLICTFPIQLLLFSTKEILFIYFPLYGS